MRTCGVLLPIASLPSKYGIGTFSKEAYEFIDQLWEAGQNYWQILPLGPTGYGDSPYQSFSAFAGNPYFIDLDQLKEEGLLTEEECQEADCGQNLEEIPYEAVYQTRFQVLRKAYDRLKRLEEENEAGKSLKEKFEEELSPETIDYCFYAAVKKSFGEKSWSQWDEDIKLRKPEAVARYQKELEDEICFYEFQQVTFLKQWKALKEYAHRKDIQIIGDIPIYVAFDSADSWAHPELFQFDEESQPVAVAGCPPDAFSATGQLWGNPLYRWDYHKKTGFAWWMKRIRFSFELYDMVRVDHFRGFDQYYAIPFGETTAIHGAWEDGPGIAIFEKIKEVFGKVNIIAEDLGFLTPSVLKLLEDTGFPGMKVLEFAFNAGEESSYLPYLYQKNCVVYTGTHDNDTVVGWYEALSPEDRKFVNDYMGISDLDEKNPLSTKEIAWNVIRLALASTADLAVIPMQDYLGLNFEARINTPSTLGGNWTWRMKKDAFTPEIRERCRQMNRLYGRRNSWEPETTAVPVDSQEMKA